MEQTGRSNVCLPGSTRATNFGEENLLKWLIGSVPTWFGPHVNKFSKSGLVLNIKFGPTKAHFLKEQFFKWPILVNILSDMMVTQEASGSRDIAIDTNHVSFNQPLKRSPDEYLPIPNVIKIMRQVLPPHVKILDDSKEMIQECVSEFIVFVTRAANEKCHGDCRRIIKPEDILSALRSIGFDDYVEPLAIFLKKYRSDSQVNATHVHSFSMPKVPDAMNLVRHPHSESAIFGPEPHVIQPTMAFGHASPSTSTLDQDNANELAKILDYLISDQSSKGESLYNGSLFEPYNKPLD